VGDVVRRNTEGIQGKGNWRLGESYRLREKLKAGLLKPKLGADRGSDADASPEKP